MQDVLESLLGELRQLGATIVFANFWKIIIETGENDLFKAKAKCKSMLETIKSRQQWIDLEALHFWRSLLFVNQYNYCGVTEKYDKTKDEAEQEAGTTTFLWNIAEYLPSTVIDHFHKIVSQYVIWMYRSETMEYIEDEVVSFVLTEVLRSVDEIHKQMGELDESEFAINNIVDSLCQLLGDFHRESVTIELIKIVCAVLEFDKNVDNTFWISLKKNLLKYVRVSDWDPNNSFNYEACHCHSFILPNVICSHCYDCRDLDLCCDMSLLTEEWCCPVPECGLPYDSQKIENTLAQIVGERQEQYLLQDFVCPKCNSVAKVMLRTYCDDCGMAWNWKGTVDTDENLREIKVISLIASCQNFKFVEDMAQQILETGIDKNLTKDIVEMGIDKKSDKRQIVEMGIDKKPYKRQKM